MGVETDVGGVPLWLLTPCLTSGESPAGSDREHLDCVPVRREVWSAT